MNNIRNSVKIILLNAAHQVVLLCTDDERIKTLDGKYDGRFWSMIGGKIEDGKTMLEAAKREIWEETGISANEIDFGPEVWQGTVNLELDGTMTTINQRFMVAKTKQTNLDLSKLTEDEKPKIKDIRWFSVEEIQNSKEIIYPAKLADYLVPILNGKYPKSPIAINLGAPHQ